MAGKGGGAWKVAYADFVTAMMAFFLVMWITAQDQQVREAVAHNFSDPFGALDHNGKSGGSETSGPVGDGEAGNRMWVRPTAIKIFDADPTSLGTEVFFAKDSAELDDAGRERLETLFPFLMKSPQKIEIRSHSSSSASAPAALALNRYSDNWQLCFTRCQNVLKFLQQEGVPVERMRLVLSGQYDQPAVAHLSREGDSDRVEVRLVREFGAPPRSRPANRESLPQETHYTSHGP